MRHYISDVHEVIKLQKKQSNVWTILKRVMSQITWLKPVWNVIIQPADAIIKSRYESSCIQAIAILMCNNYSYSKSSLMLLQIDLHDETFDLWVSSKVEMEDSNGWSLSPFEAASLSSGVTASSAEASLAISMRKMQCWSPFPVFSAFPLWDAWHTAWCLSHDPNTRVPMNVPLMLEPHHHNWL